MIFHKEIRLNRKLKILINFLTVQHLLLNSLCTYVCLSGTPRNIIQKKEVDTKQRLSKQRLLQNSDSYKTATYKKQQLNCYKTKIAAQKIF